MKSCIVMKIEYWDGCTGGFTIDDEDVGGMGQGRLKDILGKLLPGITDTGLLQELIRLITEHEGEMEDLGKCETCGDWVYKYTLEV